jgi:hypothetical protein
MSFTYVSHMTMLHLSNHLLAKFGGAFVDPPVSRYVLLILSSAMIWFLSKLYMERMRFKRLKAQGIVRARIDSSPTLSDEYSPS